MNPQTPEPKPVFRDVADGISPEPTVKDPDPSQETVEVTSPPNGQGAQKKPKDKSIKWLGLRTAKTARSSGSRVDTLRTQGQLASASELELQATTRLTVIIFTSFFAVIFVIALVVITRPLTTHNVEPDKGFATIIATTPPASTAPGTTTPAPQSPAP